MNEKCCFLTGESDCDLTDLTVDGVIYWIKEDIADEHPLKKLKQLIKDKLEELDKEKLEVEQKKNEAVARIAEAAKDLGISKEDLGRLLLGEKGLTQPEEPEAQVPAVVAPKEIQARKSDKGFTEVDGDLKTGVSAKVSADNELPPAMPGYSRVEDGEGRAIHEGNKRVKKLEDGIVQKSDFGTTIIRIDKRSGSELDKILKETDDQYNLTRAATAGSGHLSGSKTIDCPLCRGSGVNRVNYEKCAKCGGVGTITA